VANIFPTIMLIMLVRVNLPVLMADVRMPVVTTTAPGKSNQIQPFTLIFPEATATLFSLSAKFISGKSPELAAS